MNNTVATFYIVRHGQSHGNVSQANGEYGSFRKSEHGTPLTDFGKKQASQLAKRFKNIHFDNVYSSDLLRAKETAEIVALEKNLEVEITHVVRERHYGQLGASISKNSKAKMEELIHALETEEEKMKFKMVSDMESMEEATRRFTTFLRELAVTYPGKVILIVCHGGLIRFFLLTLGFATYAELPAGSVENTGYMIVDCDGVNFFIKETHGINKQYR